MKYCNGNQHSSRSGIRFSSLTQIIMKFGQVKRYVVVAFPCQEHISVPLYCFILNARFSELFLPLGLALHPRDFRPNLSLLWLNLLHFACTGESLNLRWQNTEVWNPETESGMKKTNGHSTALCSLGLSSGGKKPQFSSTLHDKSHMHLIIMLLLIVCPTVLVSYLTQLAPAKWSWFIGRRRKDE